MSFILLLIELAVAASSNVFPEEPAGGEGTVFVPVNSTTTFRCSVAVGYTISWQVQGPDTVNPITISESTGQFELSASNLDRSSTLTVHDITAELNGFSILCVATEEEDIFSNEVHEVVVIVYGPPPSPTNVVANVSTNALNISWSFTSIPAEVPENFSLTITNLNTSETTHTVATEEHYVFDAGSSKCVFDTYLIQVVAVNPAGSSLLSEAFANFPPLPNVSLVMDSLEYSLRRGVQLHGRIQLTVTIENINPCPDFPVVYNLVLEDFEGNRTSHTPEFSDDRISIFITILAEDAVFRFYIEAMNQFGISALTPVEIVTTDVQSVTLCQFSSITFLITCTYLSGSTARGCVYILASEGMNNLTSRIERGSSSEITANLEQYEEVIFFDWESDGTNGTTPVRTNLSFTSCPTATIAPPSLNITAVVVPVVLVVVITVIIVVIVICGVMKRRVKGSSDKGQSTAMSTRREAESDAMYDTIQEAHIDNKESVQFEDNPAYGTATNGSSIAT